MAAEAQSEAKCQRQPRLNDLGSFSISQLKTEFDLTTITLAVFDANPIFVQGILRDSIFWTQKLKRLSCSNVTHWQCQKLSNRLSRFYMPESNNDSKVFSIIFVISTITQYCKREISTSFSPFSIKCWSQCMFDNGCCLCST